MVRMDLKSHRHENLSKFDTMPIGVIHNNATQTQKTPKQTYKQLTNAVDYSWRRLAEKTMAMEKTTTKLTKTIGQMRKNYQFYIARETDTNGFLRTFQNSGFKMASKTENAAKVSTCCLG